MNLRDEARTLAVDTVRSIANDLGSEAIKAIERRIQWRWDNAPLLYLEADYMVILLELDRKMSGKPHKFALWRWGRRRRKFAAKAWAQDPAFASRCRICRDVP